MLYKTKVVFIALALFLSSVFLSRYYLLGQAVYGDGIYYYSYVRSLVRDRDLNFLNEFEHRYDPVHNNKLAETDNDNLAANTPTGLFENKYPIGAPLLWITPYYAADNIASLIRIAYPTFPNNGYSDIYQISLGLFNIFLVITGLLLTYKTLLSYFRKKVAIVAVVALTFSSNLFYYSALDPINSHPASFFAASLLLYYFLRNRAKRKPADLIILGAITGLIALIRTQDIVFLAIPMITILIDKTKYTDKIKEILLLISSFFVIFSLQFNSWKIIYGTYLAFPYLSTKEGFNFTSPHILELLTNLKNGLLLWSPFYIVAFIGLFIFYKRKRYEAKIFIAFTFLQIYMISSWSGWSQGEAFGTRMLISTLPMLTFGFAEIISKLKSLSKSVLLVAIITLFNLSAIVYFLLVLQNPTYNLGENTQEGAINKIEKLFNR